MAPGNLFVALAKRHVYGQVAIDCIAGPSEVVVRQLAASGWKHAAIFTAAPGILMQTLQHNAEAYIGPERADRFYAIGRMGCFLVGDDYGYPTDVPWAVAFPEGAPPSTAASASSTSTERMRAAWPTMYEP